MDSGKECANCRAPMPSIAGTGDRSQDVVWMVHCKACAALAEEQMALIASRPTGAKIEIFQCRMCGTPRSCRTGWRTRCMVCLDDRTRLPDNAAELARKALDALARRHPSDAGLAHVQGDDPREVWQQCALMVIADKVAALSWPGWTILATDIWGLPWDATTLLLEPARPESHGTWARHDACGTVQKVTPARPECGQCPPEETSRTHRAKADRPHHLYLVHYRRVCKFGHGTAARVREHLRAGADAICVLRAPHKQVVDAETAIKRAYAQTILGTRRRQPGSFGAGTEVLPANTALDIRKHLNGAHVEDVTHRFAPATASTARARRWWPLRP
ncbi:hypothetical protein ACRYCC_27410 [Actinomadura scrupuli]|uniref:hypothetical protein n=1 Tax=Actinomadura scrupuli TaxID=559629 RepID=UPI003D98B4B1